MTDPDPTRGPQGGAPESRPPAAGSRRAGRVRLAAAGGLVVAAAAAAYLLWPRAAPPADDDPPDPRLTADTPYRNVRPDAAYLGDAACAPCHHAVCDDYHRHPMGRS